MKDFTTKEALNRLDKMIEMQREMCKKVDKVLKEVEMDKEERKELTKKLDKMIIQKWRLENTRSEMTGNGRALDLFL